MSQADLPTLNDSVLRWLDGYFPGHRLGFATIELTPPRNLPAFGLGYCTVAFDGNDVSAHILIPQDAPRFTVAESLAHEYGHVLLSVDPISLRFLGSPALTPEETEGFCEVLRSRWIDHTSADLDARRRSLEDNLIDVYREGYRLMSSRLSQVGSVPALRDQLLTNGSASQPTPVPPSSDPSTQQSSTERARPTIVLSPHGPPAGSTPRPSPVANKRPTIQLG